MITLRLNAYEVNEINNLINRLQVINPECSVRCAVTGCEVCNIRHLCYDISHAIDYAQAYLDGRERL